MRLSTRHRTVIHRPFDARRCVRRRGTPLSQGRKRTHREDLERRPADAFSLRRFPQTSTLRPGVRADSNARGLACLTFDVLRRPRCASAEEVSACVLNEVARTERACHA
jgi:hypothetical protein